MVYRIAHFMTEVCVIEFTYFSDLGFWRCAQVLPPPQTPGPWARQHLCSISVPHPKYRDNIAQPHRSVLRRKCISDGKELRC